VNVLLLAEADVRSTGSGAERVLAHHVRGLVGRGHHVRVVSGGSGTAAVVDGVEVAHVGWGVRTPWDALEAAGRMRDASDVDVVVAYHPLLAWRLVTDEAFARVPVVSVFLSSWAEEYAVRRPGLFSPARALGYRARLAIERRVLRRAARVLPMSAFMAWRAADLHGVPAGRMLIVPGGVDRTRFRPRPRALARQELGLPVDARVVLTLRNLEPRMGLDVLLEAMPRVLAQCPDVVLVVAGAGPLREALEARARRHDLSGCVRFPGFVPEAQLADLYAAADLFVLPTQALEGFGLVTLEALASGAPVVGTPVGATPGLLTPLDGSLVTDGVSPEAIAHGLVRALGRADLDLLRQRCRDYTAAYDLAVIAARLERELEAARPRRRTLTGST
jgi:glycosyltransferase involved in cell wall biosynthesis